MIWAFIEAFKAAFGVVPICRALSAHGPGSRRGILRTAVAARELRGMAARMGVPH